MGKVMSVGLWEIYYKTIHFIERVETPEFFFWKKIWKADVLKIPKVSYKQDTLNIQSNFKL